MITTILAIVASVLAALFGGYFKGRQHGKEDAAAKQQKANADVQRKFDEIDAGRPDLDGALGRLRQRAGDDGPKAR